MLDLSGYLFGLLPLSERDQSADPVTGEPAASGTAEARYSGDVDTAFGHGRRLDIAAAAVERVGHRIVCREHAFGRDIWAAEEQRGLGVGERLIRIDEGERGTDRVARTDQGVRVAHG